MKNSLENVQERRNEVLKTINVQGSISVKDLAEKFNVSRITLRRDLKALTEMGCVNWHNGLASKIKQPNVHDNLANSGIELIKDHIAAVTPSYIEKNSTLFVNSSSLCWRAINQLASKQLTIITNNTRATECVHHPATSIILTGGEIRYPKESLVGTVAVQLLESMQSDYTLIGCDGMSLDNGITTQNIYEAEVNSTMIRRTKQKVICVADYRKIGVTSNYHVADLNRVDILITDRFANDRVLRSFNKYDIEIVQVTA